MEVIDALGFNMKRLRAMSIYAQVYDENHKSNKRILQFKLHIAKYE